MTSRRTNIATNLVAVLAGIPGIVSINYEVIKLLASDFNETELPAVQLIDMAEDNSHERGRALKTWNLSIELVIGPKTSTNYVPSQADLWDHIEKIEQYIFENPKLGLPYVNQVVLLGSVTDLHILRPLYTARVDIQIVYYQPLVSVC